MSSEPKVSIITIVYNGMPHLEQCMQSVFDQSYKNIEYILVDGGSSDGSKEFIEQNKWRLRWSCSEKDNGISDAFNKGLKHVTGDLIGILNSDDWYEAEIVEEVVSNYNEADIFHSNLRVWKKDEAHYIWQGDHSRLKKDMSICHPTVFCKKEVYKELDGFSDYKFAMDYDFLLRAMLKGFEFNKIDKVLCNLRLSGVSDANWKGALREVKEIKDSLLGEDPAHARDLKKALLRKGLGAAMNNLGLKRLADNFRKGRIE